MGKPIVERVLENIWHIGIREFIVVVSPRDSEILQHFHHEWKLKAKVKFAIQKERLGMANALSFAAPLIKGDFILSACDNLVPVEHINDLVAKFLDDKETLATLSLTRVEKSYIPKSGIVVFEKDIVKNIVEKPSVEEAPSDIGSIPLYVFKPKILKYLPEVKLSARGEYELQDAIQLLIQRDGNVTGVITKKRLYLTSPADLLRTNHHYLTHGHDKPQLSPHTVGKNTQLVTPLRIDEGTKIGENCKIGPNVYIENDCQIGNGVVIKDAIILRKSIIDDKAWIENTVVS